MSLNASISTGSGPHIQSETEPPSAPTGQITGTVALGTPTSAQTQTGLSVSDYAAIMNVKASQLSSTGHTNVHQQQQHPADSVASQGQVSRELSGTVSGQADDDAMAFHGHGTSSLRTRSGVCPEDAFLNTDETADSGNNREKASNHGAFADELGALPTKRARLSTSTSDSALAAPLADVPARNADVAYDGVSARQSSSSSSVLKASPATRNVVGACDDLLEREVSAAVDEQDFDAEGGRLAHTVLTTRAGAGTAKSASALQASDSTAVNKQAPQEHVEVRGEMGCEDEDQADEADDDEGEGDEEEDDESDGEFDDEDDDYEDEGKEMAFIPDAVAEEEIAAIRGRISSGEQEQLALLRECRKLEEDIGAMLAMFATPRHASGPPAP